MALVGDDEKLQGKCIDEAKVEHKEAPEGMETDNLTVEVEEGNGSKAEGNGDGEAGNEVISENPTESAKKHGRKAKVKIPSEQKVNELSEGENSGKKVTKEPTTPVSERPAREKKSVERFIDTTVSKKVREIVIEKGSGTLLKDIPNVVYKLSKRRGTDDILKVLHSILYGKKGKALHVKANILQFSGFVWGENKDNTKVKEKLKKLHKESLANLCDVLDVPCSKYSAKEELIAKLLEFLEAPRITTNILLEETPQKQKSKKRKRAGNKTAGRTPGKSSHKRHKNVSGSSKEEEGKTEGLNKHEDEREEENGPEDYDHETSEESEKEIADKESEEEEDDEDFEANKKSPKRFIKSSSKRRVDDENAGKKEVATEVKRTPGKGMRSPSKGTAKKSKQTKSEQNVGTHGDLTEEKHTPLKAPRTSEVADEKAKRMKNEESLIKEGIEKNKGTPLRKSLRSPSKGTVKNFRDNAGDAENTVSSVHDSPYSNMSARKNRKERNGPDDSAVALDKKQSEKKANELAEEKGKPQGNASKSDLSDEELRCAISELLTEVDFDTATLSSMVKRLGERFDTDFTERKAHIKVLIQEELTRIAEEGEDDEESEE